MQQARQVEIQSFGRPLYSEQQKEPQHDEPDYDLPTESIPPSPHPSRSEAPHEDESTAQPKHRMRRPAPPSIEEERKIKPFAKKPIPFMFHATYGNQLFSIMEHGLKSGKSQSNPSGRMHVHMACIDDVILDDDESEAALTRVPAGRDALLILAFLKDQDYGIRLSEERTALTDKTIEARNIVAAFEPREPISTELNKKDAEEELAETKANLLRFMNKYNKDPRRAHPNLTECERASLAHVDPDVNLGEEEFYFPHRDKEIVVLHIEQTDEFRGMIPKSSNKSLHEYDDRHITRADLPFATIGVFHIHPSISHGAAREDLQNETMPLVTLYQCDAVTGDANKSANTYSKLQHVFNPANGLVNILMRAYQRLWSGTKDLPLVDRMEYAMEKSCTLKSIVRHHLYMKCGSGYDRTFPDVMMTFVFGWGKTNIQQLSRRTR